MTDTAVFDVDELLDGGAEAAYESLSELRDDLDRTLLARAS